MGKILSLARGLGSSAVKRARGLTRTSVSVRPCGKAVGKSRATNLAEWFTDKKGRPKIIRARLRSVGVGGKRAASELRAQKAVKALGKRKDDAGHAIAHRFVPGAGRRNLFPQDSNLNRGAYKKMENEWAKHIAEGKEVHVHIDLKGGTANRPDAMHVKYMVKDPKTGKIVRDKQAVFKNKPGQSS